MSRLLTPEVRRDRASQCDRAAQSDGCARRRSGSLRHREDQEPMSSAASTARSASNVTAPTKILQAKTERYAYRRFGGGPARPLLFLQHFTGTLDNWDPAVTDALASGREVILFESAGVGRSSGKVPSTIAGMAAHALAFLDGLDIMACDVLGFSLGGMVAQQMAQDRPSIFRRMI